MIPAMGQDRKQATPDLLSTAPFAETSPSATKPVASAAPERRHVLPKDLPNAVKHLSDEELDRLIAASLEEAKRRGRVPPNIQPGESVPKRSSRTDDRQQGELAVSLTRTDQRRSCGIQGGDQAFLDCETVWHFSIRCAQGLGVRQDDTRVSER
jgi:hypothetical protein